jgi:hypothetical protein
MINATGRSPIMAETPTPILTGKTVEVDMEQCLLEDTCSGRWRLRSIPNRGGELVDAVAKKAALMRDRGEINAAVRQMTRRRID